MGLTSGEPLKGMGTPSGMSDAHHERDSHAGSGDRGATWLGTVGGLLELRVNLADSQQDETSATHMQGTRIWEQS